MNVSSGIVCVVAVAGLSLLSIGSSVFAGSSQSAVRPSIPSPEEMAQDIARYSRQALRHARPQ